MNLRIVGYCVVVLLAGVSLAFLMQGELAAGLLSEAIAIVVSLAIVEPSDRGRDEFSGGSRR